MKTMKVKARIDKEGILRLEVPTDLSPREVEVVLVIQANETRGIDTTGWPVGFFGHYEVLVDSPTPTPDETSEEPPLVQSPEVKMPASNGPKAANV